MRRPIHRGARFYLGVSTLRVVGSILAWTYKLLFSWLDEIAYQRNVKQFAAEVERSFAHLLSEHGGIVNSDKGKNLPRAFDYVSLTLEFKEIRIRLTRGRGELDAYVEPPRDPEERRGLGFFGQLIDSPEKAESFRGHISLDEIAQQLQSKWDQLIDVLSEENWFPSLTLPEWRRFLQLPHEEKLAVRATMAPKQPKPASVNHFICTP